MITSWLKKQTNQEVICDALVHQVACASSLKSMEEEVDDLRMIEMTIGNEVVAAADCHHQQRDHQNH